MSGLKGRRIKAIVEFAVLHYGKIIPSRLLSL